ncbi:MAG: ATP-binding cassette domain-containing protein [bacterium]|nr:ATP-binding cassette domain-containing protein [bacterium]
MDLDIAALGFRFGDDFALSVPGLRVPTGSAAVCIGPSGSGKSTLMQLCAGILLAESGLVSLGGVDWSALSERERRLRRITAVGLVFQEFELLEHLSVLENVLLPYHVQRDLPLDEQARERAVELTRAAGIEGLLRRKPRNLSQGERQRVAICRALVTQPAIVFADEPTGNLDPRTTQAVFDLLRSEVRERNATLMMVTHDHSLVDAFDCVIEFETNPNGSIARERTR